jgi:hypothetical protein
MNAELNNQLIRAMVDYLEALMHSDMVDEDTIGHLNDFLDLVEMAYFGGTPDGDRQQEYADSIEAGELDFMGFSEASTFLMGIIDNINAKPMNEDLNISHIVKFNYKGKAFTFDIGISNEDEWFGVNQHGMTFDIHYCEGYNEISVYRVKYNKADYSESIHSQPIKL